MWFVDFVIWLYCYYRSMGRGWWLCLEIKYIKKVIGYIKKNNLLKLVNGIKIKSLKKKLNVLLICICEYVFVDRGNNFKFNF